MSAPYNPYLGLGYAELCGRRKDFAKQIHAAQAARKAAERQLMLIREAMLSDTEQPDFEVSDHAVIRYLERICGTNISEIRDAIAEQCKTAEPLIGDKMRAANGHIYCVNNDGHVTTILPLNAIVDVAEEVERGGRERPASLNGRKKIARRYRREFVRDAKIALRDRP